MRGAVIYIEASVETQDFVSLFFVLNLKDGLKKIFPQITLIYAEANQRTSAGENNNVRQ